VFYYLSFKSGKHTVTACSTYTNCTEHTQKYTKKMRIITSLLKVELSNKAARNQPKVQKRGRRLLLPSISKLMPLCKWRYLRHVM
jgi:hypothetical protein